MARVVIIGAGLTGLSVAYHLEQNNFFDYVLFEKESSPGGLCRSIRSHGFTFDYTGHFFHCPQPHIIQMLQSMMGNQKLIDYVRHSNIYSQNSYTAYPFQNNLYGLPIQTIIDCITGFIDRPQFGKPTTFAEWVFTYFGKGMADHFFFPYQEKIFDVPVATLRLGWLQSVPKTSLEEILKGALAKREVDSIGYNAHFWYPSSGGIDRLINALSSAIRNPIKTEHEIVSIDAKNKKITLSNGQTESYEFIISTMPLNVCLYMTGEHRQAEKLVCNTVTNINLGISRPMITDHHWVYYPEKQYPFFRIGFPHTLKSMTPADCSSLSIEVATLTKPSDNQLKTITDRAIKIAASLFNFDIKDIIAQEILVLPHAYVIYDLWREQHVQDILDNLRDQKIYSVGRYGAWKYSSMYDALIEGQETACTILKELHGSK